MQNSPNPAPSRYEQLRLAFLHAAAGYAVTDETGNCIEISPTFTKILALEDSAANAANIFELTHPEDQSRHQQLLDQLLAGKISDFTIEKRYLRPDGATVWVRNSVTLFEKSDSPNRDVIHICEDISERRRLEEAVEAQDKLAVLGRLASSIAHEIANPLDTVRSILFLVRDLSSVEQVKAYLKAAEEELSRVAQISAQTLEFHRRPGIPAPVRVIGMLESVMSLFKPRTKESKISVHVEGDTEIALICFPSEIRQVIANLIANAIDAMPKGGLLRLRVKKVTDWRSLSPGIQITVADSGIGMSAEVRKRIYESFFTTKGACGTGLGLWVSAAIVDRHQGTIRLRSKQSRPGGAVFMIILPAYGAGKSQAPRAKSVA